MKKINLLKLSIIALCVLVGHIAVEAAIDPTVFSSGSQSSTALPPLPSFPVDPTDTAKESPAKPSTNNTVTKEQVEALEKSRALRQLDTSVRTTPTNVLTGQGTHSIKEYSGLLCKDGNCTYPLLAPIPGLLGDSQGNYVIAGNDKFGLCVLLNSWFRIGIALAGMLAVVMIVYGGFEYATSDAMSKSTEGRAKIQNALWGLLLALGTWLTVTTINPSLTNCVIDAEPVTLDGLKIPSAALGIGGLDATGGALGLGLGALDLAINSSDTLSTQYAYTKKGWRPEWNEYALQQVNESGLADLSPSDAARYFPNGNPSSQDWVNLIAKMVEKESSFNPRDVTWDPINGRPSYSVGLMQLSTTDSVVKELGNRTWTQSDLQDPYKNLQAGIYTMKNLIEKDGVITGQSNGRYTGAAKYWSVLQKGTGTIR